ncbi:hypothetical protein HHK36_024101 [Tetracentron sinense]|uniref:Uncharacterized protein n=1 Tax=Tetracentron sinense TaxID=13715 RepID=A0A834YKA7_TETSI|nr:hypothetical protein HHK36_024101 [Tetracentron sinense]
MNPSEEPSTSGSIPPGDYIASSPKSRNFQVHALAQYKAQFDIPPQVHIRFMADGYSISKLPRSTFEVLSYQQAHSFMPKAKQQKKKQQMEQLNQQQMLEELTTRKSQKTPRRLITISTSDGRWHGKWTYGYIFSLEELQLADLAKDGQKDVEVSINLTVEKHASFGFSVDGRIITSFTRKCSVCSSSYCREIDTNFDVWVLPSSRDNRSIQLPDIGGDDPSLSHLCETRLRLARRYARNLNYDGNVCSGGKNASVDGRWSRLLELRNTI